MGYFGYITATCTVRLSRVINSKRTNFIAPKILLARLMSRKICSWLTIIVRLLRGTRQASGGRHFEDFTYHSSLRNAFITFEHFYYPLFRFSVNVTDFENWKTRESFSNALWSRAKGRKISKRSTRFYCAPHGRLRGWPNERRGLLPIYFQAVPSGQVFPLTARHASFFERFDDIRYFSRSAARNRAP